MKRLLTLTAIAALFVAGTAMAADRGERLFIAPNATFATGAPATTNNDDSCDVGGAPAATLLVPFFSVSLTDPNGDNTLFTLTNTSQVPQIAHITIWTDWSFPVIDFNIFLTGYDVQGISLRDIIVNGQIPPTGIANNTASPTGSFSVADTGNPNFDASAALQCANLPGPIPPSLRADIASALTNGDYADCIQDVGGDNPTAQGYVTVDVADTCSQLLPTDPRFYTNDILWDNTLAGDYQIISIGGAFAGGESMVSIRAIPEGGSRSGAGLIPGTATPFNAVGVQVSNFPFTFYDRYTAGVASAGLGGREIDRRMPLPGVFAARFIEGGALNFDTDVQIWREGNTIGSTDPASGFVECDITPWSNNGVLPVTVIVRFDEHENPSVSVTVCTISPCPQIVGFVSEESSRNDVGDASFFPGPGTATADPGGWLYLNLNGGCVAPSGTTICSDRPLSESQAWVTSHMASEGSRFSTDFDATWLQNGCSPNPGATSVAAETGNAGVIGPAVPGYPGPNTNVTPSTDLVP